MIRDDGLSGQDFPGRSPDADAPSGGQTDDLDVLLQDAFEQAFVEEPPVEVGAHHLWQLYRSSRSSDLAADRRSQPGKLRRLAVNASLSVVVLVFPGLLGQLSMDALPGDLLYPVKRQNETVQLSTAVSWMQRDRLLIDQAERRLFEAEAVATAQPQVVLSMATEVTAIIDQLQTSPVAATRARVGVLRNDVNRRLVALADLVDDPARESVQLAIDEVVADDSVTPVRPGRELADRSSPRPSASTAARSTVIEGLDSLAPSSRGADGNDLTLPPASPPLESRPSAITESSAGPSGATAPEGVATSATATAPRAGETSSAATPTECPSGDAAAAGTATEAVKASPGTDLTAGKSQLSSRVGASPNCASDPRPETGPLLDGQPSAPVARPAEEPAAATDTNEDTDGPDSGVHGEGRPTDRGAVAPDRPAPRASEATPTRAPAEEPVSLEEATPPTSGQHADVEAAGAPRPSSSAPRNAGNNGDASTVTGNAVGSTVP